MVEKKIWPKAMTLERNMTLERKVPNIVLFMIIVSLAIISPSGISQAGDYHRSDKTTLGCTDCHTPHYSQDGSIPSWDQEDQGGPYRLLLKKRLINELCLMCHDGSDEEAPNVNNPTYESSAGAFQPGEEVEESHRHSLNSETAPPGYEGYWDPNNALTCVSCHDPHGNDYYRNLRPNPGNATGKTVTYMTGGTYDGASAIQQIENTPLNPHYTSGNIRYRQAYKASTNYGLSEWCGGCHGEFHGLGGDGQMGASAEGDTGSLPWLYHPTRGITMGQGNTNDHISLSHWSLPSLSSRVPVVSPDSIIGNEDDEVFCGSCHKAHGSEHRYNLIWDNDATSAREDGERLLNTCQQCHDK